MKHFAPVGLFTKPSVILYPFQKISHRIKDAIRIFTVNNTMAFEIDHQTLLFFRSKALKYLPGTVMVDHRVSI